MNRQEANLPPKGPQTAAASRSGAGVQVAVEDHQESLGRSLRDARQRLDLQLGDIGRTTKIPLSALKHIEAGQFERLPGDVFARGFLRSYARCVDLDGDEIVRKYALCGLRPAPVSSSMAETILEGAQASPQVSEASGVSDCDAVELNNSSTDAESKRRDVRQVLRDAFDLRSGATDKVARDRENPRRKSQSEFTDNKGIESCVESIPSENSTSRSGDDASRKKRVRTFVPPQFEFDADMTHRGPLTLGVIILVIVATLTMSYLLRRPGASTDGFTMKEMKELPEEVYRGETCDHCESKRAIFDTTAGSSVAVSLLSIG